MVRIVARIPPIKMNLPHCVSNNIEKFVPIIRYNRMNPESTAVSDKIEAKRKTLGNKLLSISFRFPNLLESKYGTNTVFTVTTAPNHATPANTCIMRIIAVELIGIITTNT